MQRGGRGPRWLATGTLPRARSESRKGGAEQPCVRALSTRRCVRTPRCDGQGNPGQTWRTTGGGRRTGDRGGQGPPRGLPDRAGLGHATASRAPPGRVPPPAAVRTIAGEPGGGDRSRAGARTRSGAPQHAAHPAGHAHCSQGTVPLTLGSHTGRERGGPVRGTEAAAGYRRGPPFCARADPGSHTRRRHHFTVSLPTMPSAA